MSGVTVFIKPNVTLLVATSNGVGRVAPRANRFFRNIVKSETEKYGLKKLSAKI
jgi:hypothetical protein